jgi:hypothetical protein
METIELTIQLPKTEAQLLKDYAQQDHLTISEFVDRLIQQFQRTKEYSLHPEIEAISGILPSDLDAKQEYYDYLEEKYR